MSSGDDVGLCRDACLERSLHGPSEQSSQYLDGAGEVSEQARRFILGGDGEHGGRSEGRSPRVGQQGGSGVGAQSASHVRAGDRGVGERRGGARVTAHE